MWLGVEFMELEGVWGKLKVGSWVEWLRAGWKLERVSRGAG